jgi:hypothetical protein
MENIPEVANSPPFINNAEFVKLTIYNDYGNTANGGITNIYTFSSAYKDEVIANVTYEALGGLVAVGTQPRDLRVTSADTSITLSGVDGNNIYLVLDGNIKGSKLEILRGFYGDPGTPNAYILQNTYTRFTGIVTSYAINEDREDLIDTFTVTLNASSYKVVLENRIAGRKTNKLSWQQFNTTDSSMNNVFSLADQTFDFGQDPKTKTTVRSGAGLGGSQFNNENINVNQN